MELVKSQYEFHEEMAVAKIKGFLVFLVIFF